MSWILTPEEMRMIKLPCSDMKPCIHLQAIELNCRICEREVTAQAQIAKLQGVTPEQLREAVAKELKPGYEGDAHCQPCAIAGEKADAIIALVAPVVRAQADREGFLRGVETARANSEQTLQKVYDAHEKELAEVRVQAESYKQALEEDASDLWRVTNAIKKEIASREWIMEGRGCYAWDDDRYRDETRLAFESVLKLISEVQHPAQLRFHKTMDDSLKAEEG